MRFTAATVAFFAGLAAAMPNGADTTVYQTEEVTIISCGPEVTNCPGRHTSTVPSGAAATETSVVTTAVHTTSTGGAQPVSPSSAPSWSSSAPAPAVTHATSVVPVVPVVTPSVIAHTSCSTWYETVTPSAGGAGSVPSGSSPVGSGSGSGVPHVPSSSKGSAPAGTASASPSSTPVFNGAGAVSGSLTFAGAAAAAAFFLA